MQDGTAGREPTRIARPSSSAARRAGTLRKRKKPIP
jgi:hypothetical protein